MKRIIPLDPARYQRHPIHGENRDWAETNCYVDVWIELLHALGFEPIAALPFTLGIDFEGDQWTFFKFPLVDIYELYGLDVQELAIWYSLVEHVEEQVGRGRPVLVELDSYFLPDTAGTAYQREHVKSTVAVTEIDTANHHMGYFHGQGYFHLDGQDFMSVFRINGQPDPAVLPPYVEFVKAQRREKLEGPALLEASLQLLRKHLQLLPEVNPFKSFQASFQRDLDWLMGEDLKTFHLYSFATLRQYGACFELSATYVKWLADQGQCDLEEAISAFSEISIGAKTFQFQLARAMNRKKSLNMSALDEMALSWEKGMQLLASRYS
jgi:hypothetical protein